MADESTLVTKGPCDEPNCGSSDGCATYDDGHTYCFVCKTTKQATEGAPSVAPKGKKKDRTLVAGEVRALAKRFITEETCRKWGYQCGELSGKPVQIANYCNADGVTVAQKIRFANKEFTITGDPKQLELYGMHLWRDGGKMLVITEGEIDALSVSQLQQNKWPVVSVPNGAQGAAKAIRKNIEWVEKFERVIFLFDDDDPGRDAAKECAALITPGKAHIARIDGHKDANDALQKGAGPKVIDAIWSAKEYRPDGVVSAADLIDEAFQPAVVGVPWPWEPLTEKTYGIRSKEMYIFGGGVGCGKSDVFNEIIRHLIDLDQSNKCGVLKFEENPTHSVKLLAGKLLDKRLHVPGVEATEAEKAHVRQIMGTRVFLFDHFGAMDYATVKERIRYMVVSLGCKFIFLDHITALAAAIEEENERKAIDKMCADLSAFTQQLDFTLFAVSHLTTPEGKPHEEGGRVLEKHFRGSRAIAQWFHFIFGIERNKQKPNSPTTFRLLKDRYTGDGNGLTFGLGYDRNTGRVFECELPDDDEDAGHHFKDETGGASKDDSPF